MKILSPKSAKELVTVSERISTSFWLRTKGAGASIIRTFGPRSWTLDFFATSLLPLPPQAPSRVKSPKHVAKPVTGYVKGRARLMMRQTDFMGEDINGGQGVLG